VLERLSTTLDHRDSFKLDEVDFKAEEAEEDMIGPEMRDHNRRTSRSRDTQFLDVSRGFWYIQNWEEDLFTIPRRIRVSGGYQTS
jgi:hypothetical protein